MARFDERQPKTPRYYAKAENVDSRLELELVKKKERQALLILHVSQRIGIVPNRAIGMAVNGAEPPPPAGQQHWQTKGNRFFCNIPKTWLLEGHNVVEVWDVLTGLRVSVSIYFEEEKKSTPEEEGLKQLQTRLEQRKLQKQLEVAEKPPSPAEKKLAAAELALKKAKAERELADFQKLPDPEDPELAELKRRHARLTLSVQVEQLSNQLLQLRGQASGVKAACVYCGQALPSDDSFQCKNCGSLQADFARLCEYCWKEIDPRADECVHCKKLLPTLTGSGAAYVICRYCTRYQSGYRGKQFDDWAWERRIPLLVPTYKGVKLACFDSPQQAALARLGFFWPGDPVPADVVARQLIADDGPKWLFSNGDAALEFISQFPCLCGHKDWEPDKKRYHRQKVLLPMGEAAIKTGLTIWEQFTGRRRK